MKTTRFIALTLLLAFCACKATPAWLDEDLSFEERAAALVAQMTLEEKASQMTYNAPAIERLGVPAYNWWNECLHGVARAGKATVFPQAIGMAAMWDADMMHSIASVISDEARAKHHDFLRQGKRGIYQGLTFWTPNINIFRDPRWGRGMETYGEDPYLSGELAVSFINGLQGDDPKYLKTVATIKHFAVHSGPELTRHRADVYPSDRDLYETYLPHFEKAIKEGGAYSVMCAYQRLKGTPCCGDYFLSSLLRDKWGFQGYIVSDCWAVVDFFNKNAHAVVDNVAQAAAMAVNAGTDLNCGVSYPHLPEAVQQGLITEQAIDTAVTRLMLARFKLGMFDDPEQVPYTRVPIDIVESPGHVALARQAASESMVLLENRGILPFPKSLKKVAVIGPNADNVDVLLGNYNGNPQHPVTPLQGIREKLPDAQVTYAQGCLLAEGLPYFAPVPANVLFTDASMQQPGLQGSYYNNSEYEGPATHTRIDSTVNFTWWDKAPFDDMDALHFSVQWTGVLCVPQSGTYALSCEAFTGAELTFDGRLLFQRRDEHQAIKEYEYVTLEAGKPYPITLRYLQYQTECASMRFLWDTPKPDLLKQALDVAREAEVIVLCMGLSPMLEGEEMKVKVDGFAHGDRLDIALPATQNRLIAAIKKFNKPTVLVLLNGSAVTFDTTVPAVLEAWYPGEQGGAAIADVLFGDYNPGGRLPVTFYKSIDQIPAFDNYDMEGKTYRYFHDQPLYPFGYGLSYTWFDYSINRMPTSVACGLPLEFDVAVTNTGSYDGDEVVQLYVSLPDASNPVPIKSLQGFSRLNLKVGQTQTLHVVLYPEQMASLDDNNVWMVEPGTMVLEIGGSKFEVSLIGDTAILDSPAP